MSKVRSIEEQKALYKECKRSGLSTRKFCQKNKISSKSIWLWSKKFEPNTVDKAVDSTENKLKTAQEIGDVKFFSIDKLKAPDNANTPLKVTLPNGVNINVALPKEDLNLFLQELIKWR